MKCVYIYNPKSGKQKNAKIVGYVEKRLKEKFDIVDVMPTGQRGDAHRFALNACGKYDVLVVSGGDGTLNEIINAISNEENRPSIGYIPTGTTNDLAHSLKIPKNVKKAVNIILCGNHVKHDIFQVNNHYGIYVCAFGLFTESSYTASFKNKKKFGKLAYYFSGIKEIGAINKFPILLSTNVLKIEENIVLGIIANSRYVSGYKINKMANCSDGYVNVILFKENKRKGISLRMLFKILKLFLFGLTTLKNSKDCVVLKLNNFSVKLADNIAINLDGEKGQSGSFDFKVLKQHVNIFVKG